MFVIFRLGLMGYSPPLHWTHILTTFWIYLILFLGLTWFKVDCLLYIRQEVVGEWFKRPWKGTLIKHNVFQTVSIERKEWLYSPGLRPHTPAVESLDMRDSDIRLPASSDPLTSLLRGCNFWGFFFIFGINFVSSLRETFKRKEKNYIFHCRGGGRGLNQKGICH